MILCVTILGFSQNAPITFEVGANGNTWTWTTFENGINPALEIVNNPSALGANTSAKVAKFTALTTGQTYAGLESMHGTGIGTFNLTASNSIIKMMVYKSVLSDVGIKFATAAGGSTGEIKVPNTKINQWEELTFDFSGKIGEATSTGIDQIIFFPDFQPRTTDNICYFDNITFSAAASPSAPTIAAPTPNRPAADVISLFSNAYTNKPVDTWRTSWSSASLTDLQIAGNDTKKYSSLDYVGIETVGPNLINASSMLFFHVDIWTPNITTFRVKLVDFGADKAFAGGDDKEHEVVLTPTLSGWNSLDIPLSDFTGLTTKSNIAQYIFSCLPTGTGTVYMDNMYFHKTPVVNPNIPTVAAPTPTRPATEVISLFSNAYTNKPVDTWKTSWSAATLEDVQIAGNDTKKYSNLDFAGIETVGPNLVNASSMLYFHLDLWTPNITTFRVKLVDFGANAIFGGGDDKEHEIILTPTLAGWNQFEIPMSDFTGLTTKSNIAQMIVSCIPVATGIAYIDNVYFHKVPFVDPNTPLTAAPTPTRPAIDVISLFSNAYTNKPIDTWRTSWSVATLTDLQIAGNDTKKYSNLDFVGIEMTGANLINATTMNAIHIDAWTPNLTTFKIKLVDFGANAIFGGGDDVEHELSLTPLNQKSWNVFEIPLSNFTGLTTRAHIAQIILVGAPTGTGTLFIDNVYFRKNSVATNNLELSGVKMYPNPASDILNISAKGNIESVSIYNQIGQELKVIRPNVDKTQVNISDLRTGSYFVKLLVNGLVSSTSFIKN